MRYSINRGVASANRENERDIYEPVIQIKQHKKATVKKIDTSTSALVPKHIHIAEHKHNTMSNEHLL